MSTFSESIVNRDDHGKLSQHVGDDQPGELDRLADALAADRKRAGPDGRKFLAEEHPSGYDGVVTAYTTCVRCPPVDADLSERHDADEYHNGGRHPRARSTWP